MGECRFANGDLSARRCVGALGTGTERRLSSVPLQFGEADQMNSETAEKQKSQADKPAWLSWLKLTPADKEGSYFE